MAPAIGIDLGTVFSCVAVMQDGNVEILSNLQGNRITPSCVAFTEEQRFSGDGAYNQIGSNSQHTIIDAKRLIGRKFNEISEYDLNRWSFKVINVNGKPMFEIVYKNKTERFHPEQISAAVLSEMKLIAERFLDDTAIDAVITVPAYFNDSQRQATKDAAQIAGLNVLQLINEPTAAAIAYGLSQKVRSDQNILVFDMGGGTFDVSILTIDGDVYEVKAVGGDVHLGGQDFNNKMLDYFTKEIKDKYGEDISSDKIAISRLLKECEKAKITLSTSTEAKVKINSIINGLNFNSFITRACFEQLNATFFTKAIKIVENTLNDAKLKTTDIEEILLVGGSTYIPKVQKMLQDFFNGKKLNKSVKPEEAVAYGAAVYASILNGDDEFEMVVLDVTPQSLGVGIVGDIMSTIIKRNASIPHKKTNIHTTIYDDQTVVKFEVYEGEDPVASRNNLLGEFKLVGIPKARAGVPSIDVTFEINTNGILKAHAVEKSSGIENMIEIEEYKSRLSKEDIEDGKNVEIQTMALYKGGKK